MVRPRTYVEAPPVTPLPYGLLSAALVLDDLDGNRRMGIEYEPEACGVAHLTQGECYDGVDGAFDEVTDGIPLVTGDPFTLYNLFSCRIVGTTPAALEARAASTLRLGEQRGVEAALAERLALADGAVDLTPTGGAVAPVRGLAILEQWAAANYGGVPTVHVTRGTGTELFAAGATIRSANGARIESGQGALIASGGGYGGLVGPPTDAEDPETVQAAAEGTAWAYVTGQVVVRRASRVDAVPTTMSRLPGVPTNDALALAMRAYVATWECVTGAVLIDLNDVPGGAGGGSEDGGAP